jgi:uncharacterized membrane protein YdjX (TVP38/TMEM64 family)
MKREWQGWAMRLLLLVLIIGFSAFVYLNRDRVSQLEEYGYPGIFVFNLLSNATLILPLPGVAVTSLMGTVFHPFWVAIAAGSGAALGELSGYLAGFSGRVVVERTPSYERVENWMKKYGALAVLVLAFVPNPLFDIAGIIAGALRMKVWQFLTFCWVGKVIKMLLFAYAGSSIIKFFPLN